MNLITNAVAAVYFMGNIIKDDIIEALNALNYLIVMNVNGNQ